MSNFAQVTIYNEHLAVTKIQEIEAYTLDHLFSDIGIYIKGTRVGKSRVPEVVAVSR